MNQIYSESFCRMLIQHSARLGRTMGRTLYVTLLIALMALSSCAKDTTNKEDPKPDPPVPPPPPKQIEYLEFNLKSARNMTVDSVGKNTYSLKTINADPYVATKALKNDTEADSCVLTFEYMSTASVDYMQFYFGPPISEERSIRTQQGLPSAARWTTWSIILKDQMKLFNWGKTKSVLRMDFGDTPGITIMIRNIRFRAMNEEEKRKEEEEQRRKERLERISNDIKEYLNKTFTSQISQVNVTENSVQIQGNYVSADPIFIAEVSPDADVTETMLFPFVETLNSPSFSVTYDRYVTRDGIKYDRALSKWVLVKFVGGSYTLMSHARYPDQIAMKGTSPAKAQLKNKKGLGALNGHGLFISDMDDLDIGSVTLNIPTGSLVSVNPQGGISHEYGGKTYYFYNDLVASYDAVLKEAQKRNVVVAAIILINQKSHYRDPKTGEIMAHPDHSAPGIYAMPNMTTTESVNLYAATLDFLAERYCKNSAANGRIHHWIMHNEVDAGYEWTNMGVKPMIFYTDTYVKSMRMCYNIVRQYDTNSEIFGSFTHSWVKALGVNYYSTRSMLELISLFGKKEGEFKWALAAHPYPQDLTEPRLWEKDTEALWTMSTPLATFKNLEVLDKWIKKPENLYNGTKRSLWLSENGTNSRSYSQSHMMDQAAGFAYAWIKIQALDGIDGIQWHNWMDNRAEYGLRIGLRKYGDEPGDPAGAKLVWHAYKAAGTAQQESVFEPYKGVIGIKTWAEIIHSYIPD